MASEAFQVKVPRVNANEDEALLTHVLVSVGDWVEAGQELFTIESSKAAMSIESEISGYVTALPVEVGSMIPVGAVLCMIGDDEHVSGSNVSSSETLAEAKTNGLGTGIKITAKERLEARRRMSHQSLNGFEPAISSDDKKPGNARTVGSAELPWVRDSRAELDRLSNGGNQDAWNVFEALPAITEVSVYSRGSVHIGKDAHLGEGSVLRAKRLYVGDGVQIGDNCHIEADSIYIGAASKIGTDTHVVSGELILGEGVVVADQVIVDMSGGRSEESRLLIGHGSLISSRAIINTCREVVIEQGSAISPGAMLFTHSFWQSVLEGYSAVFQGVRVCENAWVGAGCQILPGVTVGYGSIVMSNSTVVEDVPSHSLVGGVPAKVIRNDIKREISDEERNSTLIRLIQGFVQELEFKGCSVEGSANLTDVTITLPGGETRHLVLLSDDHLPESLPPKSIVVTVGQSLPLSGHESVFDVTNLVFTGVEDRLTHDLRNYLRRHGIRFRPYAWDASYARGL